MSELNEYIQKQIQRILPIQTKIEICEKDNASFFAEGNKSMSPEIEADCVKYIEEFEQQFEKARNSAARIYRFTNN